ncbi:universal stress protein [Nucisporomicrobium flavum]|uniref:universal stress protein n=1 Tax=Nucisporomicrobium flavum TaxID=2785915 RepID=UPI0027DC3A14|nr:universal stress protein [Nucisporomicrobium flavum]
MPPCPRAYEDGDIRNVQLFSWIEEAAMIGARIVVGVDGSPGSRAAVQWAAAEALMRGAELRVLTAYHRPETGAATSAILHAAVTHARTVAPGVEVSCVAQAGYAVPVLLHAAEVADMLVVGCRRGGGLPGAPHGTVGNQVATHARCCVVVVRGRAAPDTGPVVAGVGDGAADGAVLGRAFEEAALRHAEVLAVTTQDRGLADSLATWRDKFPEVPAECEVADGDPGKVLVDRSRRARLVTVGPRRHGFEGVMLGAIGGRLVDHADCPVLVARP